MRSPRSGNKGTTRQPSLARWVDIEVRSVVRYGATRRIEWVGSIDPAWPMTRRGGDAAGHVAMSALAHPIGSRSRRASSSSGALSRPLAGCDISGGSRSATRLSTAISGVIESGMETSASTCAVLPNNAENGTVPTILVGGSPVNVPSLSVPLGPRTEAVSVTSKPIPSSVTSPTSTASSPSSIVRVDTS